MVNHRIKAEAIQLIWTKKGLWQTMIINRTAATLLKFRIQHPLDNRINW